MQQLLKHNITLKTPTVKPKFKFIYIILCVFLTDMNASYKSFKPYYNVESVKHSVEYVSSKGVHCNAVESFWSLLKRGIYGIYHWASKKHIQGYLNEFSFRYSKRALTDFAKVEEWFARCEGKRIMYKQLING